MDWIDTLWSANVRIGVAWNYTNYSHGFIHTWKVFMLLLCKFKWNYIHEGKWNESDHVNDFHLHGYAQSFTCYLQLQFMIQTRFPASFFNIENWCKYQENSQFERDQNAWHFVTLVEAKMLSTVVHLTHHIWVCK